MITEKASADTPKAEGDTRASRTIVTRARSQRATVLAGAVVMAALLGWLQWRALASTRDTCVKATEQLGHMRVDTLQIERLRKAPQAAVSRTKPNEELLARVQRSLAAAGIDRTKWHDSIPQSPVRVRGTDYRRFTTRVYFEGVTLKQLASFAHHLQTADPTLGVSAVNLGRRRAQGASFDVDLAVSYLVFAPGDT